MRMPPVLPNFLLLSSPSTLVVHPHSGFVDSFQFRTPPTLRLLGGGGARSKKAAKAERGTGR